MKLLYFTPQLSNFGGIERTITDKANYLTNTGHHVLIVTYEQLNRPYAYNLGKDVEHIDLGYSFNLLYRYPLYKRIFKYLELLRSVKKGLRKAINLFNPDLIVVTSPDTEHYLRSVFSVSKGKNIVIESHASFGFHFLVKGTWCHFSYLLQRPKDIFRKADLVIALTNGDAQCWDRFKVKKIKVVPNPVTFYCDNVNTNKIPGRILAVGRLNKIKRFDRLIHAFSLVAPNCPVWHLVIVGDGEEKENLNNLISELNLTDRIRILPATRDIVSEYMKSQFLTVSSDLEGFSLVLIEAMACGLPCVSTACPYGPIEIIEEGISGLLSKMDEKDLADKMEWMITHEHERHEMGIKAHKAAARYKKETVMKEWENAYLSVSSNNNN